MYFICYLILPAVVAWKRRSADTTEVVFALYSTMLGAFLAVWCEAWVRNSIAALIPQDKMLIPWYSMATILLIWFIAEVIFKKILEAIKPEGFSAIVFPEKVTKFLVPLVVFLHTGLICALIFTALAVSPVRKYVPFVIENASLCATARNRMLWNSFFIDRFSWQPVTVTQRRRAFDRFVPENIEDFHKAQAPSPKRRKVK